MGSSLVTIFDKFWYSQKERIKKYLANVFSGKEDSLSFNEKGLMNNNYPSLQYFREVGDFIEDFYTYYKMTVYTCGFSNIRGSIEKGGVKATVDLSNKNLEATVDKKEDSEKEDLPEISEENNM